MKGPLQQLALWIERLREASAYIAGMPDGMPETIRHAIARALDVAYEEATNKHGELEYSANDGKHWSEQDVEVLVATLAELPIARNYSISEINMLTLSLRLRRNEKSVRRKVDELGKTDRVDYWYARHLHNLKEDET